MTSKTLDYNLPFLFRNATPANFLDPSPSATTMTAKTLDYNLPHLFPNATPANIIVPLVADRRH